MTDAPEKIWLDMDDMPSGCDKQFDADIEYTRSDLIYAMLAQARAEGREEGIREAASIASNACLVPPDGGSPTADEVAVCDEAYRRIMSLIPAPAKPTVQED